MFPKNGRHRDGQTWISTMTEAPASAIDFFFLMPKEANQRNICCSSCKENIISPDCLEEKRGEKMAGEDEVKLLGFWASPFALEVMIGLEEKGVKYEYVEEDIFSNKSPLLLQMNPLHKQVPVLIHNGSPVVESSIILQYIDEVWTNHGPSFLPSDPYDRAMARFWVDFIGKKVIVPGRLLIQPKREEQEEGRRQVIESLGILEETLKGKDYFGGTTFGMIDIAFAPVICFFRTYEVLGDFKIMCEDTFPNIVGWVKKCMERKSIKKVLPQPEKVLQTVLQFTKRSV